MAQHTSHITIQTPAMNVWQALTDPTLVKRWQYGSDLVTDWQPGHGIRFHSEWQGQVYEQWGTVLEFAPYRRIRYSLFAPRPGPQDAPENYFVMAYSLDEEDGVTNLTITMMDNRPGADDGGSGDEEGHGVLDALKATAESL